MGHVLPSVIQDKNNHIITSEQRWPRYTEAPPGGRGGPLPPVTQQPDTQSTTPTPKLPTARSLAFFPPLKKNSAGGTNLTHILIPSLPRTQKLNPPFRRGLGSCLNNYRSIFRSIHSFLCIPQDLVRQAWREEDMIWRFETRTRRSIVKGRRKKFLHP